MKKVIKKVRIQLKPILQPSNSRLNPFYFMIGALIVYICLDLHQALALGDNLGDFVGGVKAEGNGFARNAVGTAVTAGLGLMSMGAGNTGKMVAMTGMTGSLGYMVWPMIERKMMSLSGSR
jgi:hypothetical protein